MTEDEIRAKALAERISWPKYGVAQPERKAQEFSDEARAAMSTLDVLAQVVLPRLVDRLNMLEWSLGKVEYNFSQFAKLMLTLDGGAIGCESLVDVSRGVDEVRGMVEELQKQLPKKRASRGKKATETTPVPEPDMSEWADYDPDKDVWKAKKIGNVLITATVVEDVEAGDCAHYAPEAVAFVQSLSEGARHKIKEMF